MYKIRLTCYDPQEPPYEDIPSEDKLYSSIDETIEAMISMAEDEVETLNNGCDKNVSFGVVVDEKNNKVYVKYYYLEDETDTTGNTEIVTEYKIIAEKEME